MISYYFAVCEILIVIIKSKEPYSYALLWIEIIRKEINVRKSKSSISLSLAFWNVFILRWVYT